MWLREFARWNFGVASMAAFGLLVGCGNPAPANPQTSSEEVQRLRAENQDVAKLRRENQELPRLRKDNDEIQKLRSVPQELAALRKENDDLRLASGKPRAQFANPALIDPATGKPLSSDSSIAGQAGDAPQPTNSVAAVGPDDPLEGDEILIDPKLLGRLLPGFDWDKLERKEPVAIKSLLDQQGIVLTNYQQLRDFGITNYIIQRNPPKPATEEPKIP